MRLLFDGEAFSEYEQWQSQDRRTLKKINSLIKDIGRHGPLTGLGKPERLKYHQVPTYSRRIDEANRLVYLYDGTSQTITILSCIGHYE